MAAHAIVVENLDKYFPPARTGWRALLQPWAQPSVRALAGVSFAAAAGEAVALIGTNGAGKSTLLRILATLILPTRGRATVAGYDLERQPALLRQQIGYDSGAEAGFYGRLTARENLEFFATLNNLPGAEAARRTAASVALLGLGAVLDLPVRTLSTGILHRLGLARALLHEPRVLLLDEPTRSLDPLAATDLRRFLKNDLVRQRGATLLFATHALADIEQLADRIAVLEAGQLLACDRLPGLLASTGAASLDQALARLTRRTATTEPAS